MKVERKEKLLELIEARDFLKVNEAAKLLDVTEMTIRRDLRELESANRVRRIHGGAKKLEDELASYTELSHKQKRELYVEEKKEIAKKAAALIRENDTVFLGPGTTTEYIYDYIEVRSAKIITNSISIYNRFKNDPQFDLILIGGTLRERTGTFVGYFTGKWMQDIKVNKVFLGTNGIKDGQITTADEEEGVVQKVILNNSNENYILADSSKFGVEAFQSICNVDSLTAIITDEKLPETFITYYQNKCKLI